MSFDQSRKLPTFRFDEHTVRDMDLLAKATAKRYEEFLEDAADEQVWIPPLNVISSIINVNSQKRRKAFEQTAATADGKFPPQTTIASIMNYGGPLPGVPDRYFEDDYPSHEVFAYNRLGRASMLNRKFGEKCIQALDYAYPDSRPLGQFEDFRARVHRIIDAGDEPLVVVSTKETIDRREHNNRTGLLVSRVTGVARMNHEAMKPDVAQAVESLADRHCDVRDLVGAKAVLAEYIQEQDGTGAVVPVIQTMYQTQR